MRKQLLVIGVMALALLVIAPGIAHAAPGDFACQATVLRAPSIEISTGFTPTCEERVAGLSTIRSGFVASGLISVKALHAETGKRFDSDPDGVYRAEAEVAEVVVRDRIGTTLLRLAGVFAQAEVVCAGNVEVLRSKSETLGVEAAGPLTLPGIRDSLDDHAHILTPLGLVHLNHIEKTEHTDGSVTVVVTAFVLEPNSLTPGASIVVGQALAGHTPDSCP
jgi:hypothetical protein